MQKIFNIDAMQPSQKPHIIRKSFTQLPQPKTNHSTGDKKQAIARHDYIREISPEADSPFREHPLYSKQQQLASSFSCSEQQNEHQYETLLFSKFLQSQEESWISFMHDMNKISHEKLVSIVKIGDNQQSIKSNRVLAHFIGVWLISMGYKDPQTLHRAIRNVQFLFPNQQEIIAQITSRLYDKLFQGYLPQSLQLKFLLELCRRGWEYFSFFVGKFITALRKYQMKPNKNEESFLKQIEKAIK